jgi:hypothetical protein
VEGKKLPLIRKKQDKTAALFKEKRRTPNIEVAEDRFSSVPAGMLI